MTLIYITCLKNSYLKKNLSFICISNIEVYAIEISYLSNAETMKLTASICVDSTFQKKVKLFASFKHMLLNMYFHIFCY